VFFSSYLIESFINCLVLKNTGIDKVTIKKATMKANIFSYCFLFLALFFTEPLFHLLELCVKPSINLSELLVNLAKPLINLVAFCARPLLKLYDLLLKTIFFFQGLMIYKFLGYDRGVYVCLQDLHL
jgi:hypothetical protein